MAEQEKGPCPANDNGCPAASPLIPAFGGLPKPLADNLLVRRVSLRPPPMTMNDGDDSHVGNGFPKAGLAAHRALNEPTRLDIGTCHRCEALIWRQAMPKVALYARYSADNQSVVSIEDQFRICRKHAGRERWQVVDTYHDAAISGASVILRPGVQSLLQDAQCGRFDIVLAEALDRVSRDQGRRRDTVQTSAPCRRADRYPGRGRNLRALCTAQRHDECAVPEGPRRQDPSWFAWAGGERQGRRRALLWLRCGETYP
jgi:hypothetical protein